MQTNDPVQSTPAGEDVSPSHCSTRACSGLWSRRGTLIWLLVLGAIAYVQWPMLKGLYYRSAGTPARRSAVDWRSDLGVGLAEAKRTGKPLLLDFSASWCPPCQVMKHDVWPDAQVGRVVNGAYVPVLVDVDDPRNAEVAQRYGVRGIPTIIIVDLDGNVLRQGAFMSRSDVLEFLKPKT
jgi:thiol:disulfide interchange protein